MALFKPYKLTSSSLNSLPITEGQLIITTDDKSLYIDVSNNQRIQIYSDELSYLESLETWEFAVVESLPTENINENCIYLVPTGVAPSGEGSGGGGATYTLTKSGDTITLTGSNGTTDDISIAEKVDKVTGKGLSENDFTAALKTKLEGIESGAQINDNYTIVESTVTTGYAKTYSLTKNGTELGVKINIPKDLVISSGSVETVITANVPYSGAAVGDKYLDIQLNDANQNNIYIPVNDLVDAYTAGNGIDITAANAVSIKIDNTNANGLAITNDGLKLNVVSTSAAGAMSAADKIKLDGIDTSADENVIETIQLNGTPINISNKTVNIQVNNLSTADVQNLIDASITNALEASY